MLEKIDMKTLKLTIRFQGQKEKSGFNASVICAFNDSLERPLSDTLLISMGGFTPEYRWSKNFFSAHLREYLEYYIQRQVDTELERLEVSELWS